MKTSILTSVFILLIGISSTAKTTRSVASGNWNTSGTWDNGVPVPGDKVYIENGDAVTLTATTSIADLYIEGNSTSFTINTGVILVVSNYVVMIPTGNSQSNNLVINGTLYTSKSMSPRTVSGFTGYTANISGSGVMQLVQDLLNFSFSNGTMTVNLGCVVECRNMYNYSTGAASSMTLNLTDSINVKRNIILQAQSVAATSLTINMNNASAKIRMDGVFDIRNNGGQITQGTAESIFYFGNLSNYLANANIDYRNIGIESQTLSGNVNISKVINNVIIDGGKTLTTNGNDLLISAGNLVINGNISASTGDVLSMAGSSAQTITVNSATNVSVLDISNTSGGVSIAGSGSLNVTTGVTFSTPAATALSTNGKVVLKDNGSGMASLGNLNSHTVSGNVTCEFRTQTLSNIEYRLLTVPITGVTLGDIDYNASNCADCLYTYGFPGSNWPSTGGIASTYSYNNGSVSSDFDEGWTVATNVSNTISPQNGLTWYIGPGSGWGSRSAYSIDVTGAPNVGPYTISAANGSTMTFSGSGANFNWALVGNPFPSTIDYSLVTRNNVSGDSYLFKADNGGYALDNIIPPFQAFFVKVTGASPSLVFNESDKSTTQKVYQKNVKDNDEIQVKLSTSLYPHKFNYTYLRFNKGATANFDAGMDKYQFSNPYPYPNVSFKTADDTATYRYVTDPDQGHIKIPLNAHGYVSGTYELSFSNLDKINGCVILEDTYTGNSKNLTASDSLYSFILSDTATNARFVLHVYNFAKEMLTTNSSCYGENSGSNTLEFYNLGNYITSWMDEDQQYVGGSFNASISETISDLAPGNYSIEIQSMDLNCPAVTEYFSIHEPAEMKTNFGFANQLLSFRTNKEIEFKNLSTGGIASYLWDFGDNQTSTEMEPKHSYTAAGVYEIVLTAENGNSDCNVAYKQSIEVAEATGLTELSNSAGYQLVQEHGQFNVHFTQAAVSDMNYRVFDVQGKLLNRGTIEKGSMVETIEVKGQGIVLINMHYNNQTETVKAMKQ